jgi:cytochrome b pre-mRNA-processing protein 3
MLLALGRSGARKRICRSFCEALNARAREPMFFRDLKVADTLDGRFDLVALHAWLLLDWLGSRGERELSQTVIDMLFVDFDESMRELGTGDMGMGRRMKKMADAFYGRLDAYRVAADEAALTEAIRRNIYRGEAGSEIVAQRLARYVTRCREHLSRIDPHSGAADFGSLP